MGFDIVRMNPDHTYPEPVAGKPTIYIGTMEDVGFGHLRGNIPPGRHVAIDEIDEALVHANTTYILAEGAGTPAPDHVVAEVTGARDLLNSSLAKDDAGNSVLTEADLGREPGQKGGPAVLTEEGRAKLEESLGRTLTEQEVHRLNMAAAAKYEYRDKVHYIVTKDGRVLIIDQTTHKVMFDPETSTKSRWNGGLAQAIEAEHGLRIRDDPESSAEKTAKEVVNGYDSVKGASGTATGVAARLEHDYGAGVTEIPRNEESKLIHGADDVSPDEETKLDRIAADIVANHKSGRPQLVLAHRNDIVGELSDRVARLTAGTDREGIEHVAVDATWVAENGTEAEARLQEIFDEAGKAGKILIINMQGARGVDIPIGDDVNAMGGLHVLVTGHSATSHDIDIQAENRAARAGQRGSVQYYTSPEDDLYALSRNPAVQEVVIRYTNSTSHAADGDAPHDTLATEQQLRDMVGPLQDAAAARLGLTRAPPGEEAEHAGGPDSSSGTGSSRPSVPPPRTQDTTTPSTTDAAHDPAAAHDPVVDVVHDPATDVVQDSATDTAHDPATVDNRGTVHGPASANSAVKQTPGENSVDPGTVAPDAAPPAGAGQAEAASIPEDSSTPDSLPATDSQAAAGEIPRVGETPAQDPVASGKASATMDPDVVPVVPEAGGQRLGHAAAGERRPKSDGSAPRSRRPAPTRPAAQHAARSEAPQHDSNRGRCAELALKLIRSRTGSKWIRMFDREVGLEGVTGKELERAAMGQLRPTHHAALDGWLRKKGNGYYVLVVDEYTGGAHAYVMGRENGKTVVRDPSTGKVYDYPPTAPMRLRSTHAILFDKKGRPVHPLVRLGSYAAHSQSALPDSVRIGQPLDDHAGQQRMMLRDSPTGKKILRAWDSGLFPGEFDDEPATGGSGTLTAVVHSSEESPVGHALRLAYESVHAERFDACTSALQRVRDLSEADFVAEMVAQEAEATGRRFRLAAELRAAGTQVPEHELEPIYRAAYDRALAAFASTDPVTLEQRQDMAHAAAVDRLHQLVGTTRTDGSDTTYQRYWSDLWHEIHPAPTSLDDHRRRPDSPEPIDARQWGSTERHIAAYNRIADRLGLDRFDPTMSRDTPRSLVSDRLRFIDAELSRDDLAPQDRAQLLRRQCDLWSLVYAGDRVLDAHDVAAFEWADDAYVAFRGDDRDIDDIDDIGAVLAQYPRTDGTHFTRDEVRQIKNHLFREEHPILDYDGGIANRRYAADPDIAEAWIRLRAGSPHPADLVLLGHELAESNSQRSDRLPSDSRTAADGTVLFEGELPAGDDATPLYRGIPRLLPDGSVNPAYEAALTGRVAPRGTLDVTAERRGTHRLPHLRTASAARPVADSARRGHHAPRGTA